jgi:hypothetical protein
VWRPASFGPAAFGLYLALSLALTWPVILGLGSDVPGDLGDSLLNMWILGWGAEHVPKLLAGSISWAQFWNANIFHPDPNALALSEHLFGQTLQILPIYWLTGNIILCYNLLFISTFALSAFGTYLLVLDLTGDRRAAFIAGLVYGFLPYRIASVPHVQVMSSQWMPFALWGLNRFVTTGSRRALLGGTAALVMQNWSCGYYLLYFAPFVPLFVLHRMWTLGTLHSVRTWLYLVAAAVVTLVCALPFLLPYQEVQRAFGIERSFGEVILFSANVWSYITASENLTLWGKALRFYPHGEGETFLGFVPWLLASVAVATLVGAAFRKEPTKGTVASAFRRTLTWLLLLAVVTQLIAVLSVVLFGGFDVQVLGITISARTPQRLMMQFTVALVLLLIISASARIEGVRFMRSPIAFALIATVLAMWLSLGPIPKAGDTRVSGFGLYGILYDYVPGFNGVRVPARYAMIAGLFLAILAGFGAARILGAKSISPKHAGDSGVRRRMALAVIALLILIEGAAIPMEINRTWSQNQAMPPARVMPYASGPPVYTRVKALPAGSAITEFPFGDAAWEIRYVYYAAAHWKPITNGYSGAFPPRYKERVARLQRVATDPEAAWKSLKDSGSTHAIVHRNAFANAPDADTVERWLKARGAIEIERFPDGDILLKL